jgi:iron(III) transport system permease protein
VSGLARRVPIALALAVAAVAVVLPIGGMLVASLRAWRVTAPTGAWRAAGDVVVAHGVVRFQVAPTEAADETVPMVVPARGARVEREWSLAHWRAVWASPRTGPLLANSARIALGATLLALLLGLPAGWLVARASFPGRGVFGALLAGPLLIPPFFLAMAVAADPRAPFSVGSLLARAGLSGSTLQVGTSIACFGLLYHPLVALVAGRAMAAVPAGLVEAARLSGGRAAAFGAVVLPAVLPSTLAAALLVFVLALSDFAVPDILGVFLGPQAVPVHTFATEVFLQWTKNANVGRAVATGAPFLALTLAALVLALVLARRGPAAWRGGAHRARPRVVLRGGARLAAWAFAAALVGLALAAPLAIVGSWGFSPARVPDTFAETPRLGEDTARWLRVGVAAAAIAVAVSVPIARWALRGGRVARATAVALAALPLATPAMVLSVGTLLLWSGVAFAQEGVLRPALCLAGRFLPWTLAATWLALRETDPGLEDAARVAGAGPVARATRVWGPLAAPGVAVAFLLALVLALRELDALVLLEPAVLPVRIYDKVHFGRTAQVADLSMALLGAVLIPAVLAGSLLVRRAARPEGPPGAARPSRDPADGVP